MKAKVLVQTGGDDQLVPLDQVNRFQNEMTKAGVELAGDYVGRDQA